MPINQNQYSQAVLKAQLVTANTGNELVLAEMKGCEENWSQSVCTYRQIQGALYFLEIGDYESADSLYFYDTMLQIIGLNYLEGVTPDPNAQLPDGVTIVVEGGGSGLDPYYDETDLIDSGGGNWYLPLIDKNTGDPLPDDYRPVLLTVNGVSFFPTYDENFTPTRLYGFSDNEGPKIIVVTFLITSGTPAPPHTGFTYTLSFVLA